MAVPVPKIPKDMSVEEWLAGGVAKGLTTITVRGYPYVDDNGICDVCGDHEDNHNACRWKACESND